GELFGTQGRTAWRELGLLVPGQHRPCGGDDGGFPQVADECLVGVPAVCTIRHEAPVCRRSPRLDTAPARARPTLPGRRRPAPVPARHTAPAAAPPEAPPASPRTLGLRRFAPAGRWAAPA